MKQALLVAGGYRIGDTFHLIPLLNKLAQDHEITWYSGNYEKIAVEFLASVPSLNIKEVHIVPEHRKPGDLSDRETFVASVLKPNGKDIVDTTKFDTIVSDVVTVNYFKA